MKWEDFKMVNNKFNEIHAKELYICRQYAEVIRYCSQFPNIAQAICLLGLCLDNGYGCPADHEKGLYYLQKAAKAGNLDALYSVGIKYLYGQNVNVDVQKGIKLLNKACERGNENAMTALGKFYYFEDPLYRNIDKAKKLIKQAAYLGEVDALGLYASLINRGAVTDEPESAFYWYKKAAEKKEPHAMMSLAYCYKNGEGTQVNIEQYVYWIRKAVDAGNCFAMAEYADMLKLGDNVKQDKEAAFRLYKKSVALNNASALVSLGLCYLTGTGTKKSIKDACTCFKDAANNGDAIAMSLLGCALYLDGETNAVQQAIDWHYKAVENGISFSAYLLGRILDYEGIPYKVKPLELYKMAANDSIPDAMVALADCYLVGCSGASQNPQLAFKWYTAASGLQNISAVSRLGYCYLYGLGTEKDYDQAFELLNKSSSEEISMELLGELYLTEQWANYNVKKAATWFKKAAKFGNQCAKNNLAYISKVISSDTTGKSIERPLSQRKIDQLVILQKQDEFAIQELKKEIEQLLLSSATKDAEILNLKRELAVVKESVQSNTDDIIAIKKQLALLQNDIAQHKHEIEQKLEKCVTESEEESLYQHFIFETAQMINQAIAASIQNSVKGIKDELVRMFGQYWSELDEYTQTSLISAKVFLSRTNDDSLDYSGIVISATSALENELEHRFHSGYQKYLRNMFGNDYSQWPRSMVYSDRTRTTWKKQFTLGSMPEIFGGETRTNDCSPAERKQKCWLYDDEKQCINEYLNTILRVPDKQGLNYFLSKANGLNYIDRCEDVRCLYRNAAAHTAPIRRDDAIDCYNYIIGHQDASEQIGAIQGLIFDLVKMTRIPK